MNYFALYETRRNHLKVGSKWEWQLHWYTDSIAAIVEIIDVRDDELVRYRYISGGCKCHRSKKDFLDNFKPYNETST